MHLFSHSSQSLRREEKKRIDDGRIRGGQRQGEMERWDGKAKETQGPKER